MTRRVTGTLYTPAGVAVASATLRFVALATATAGVPQGVSASTTTNETGVYDVTLLPGYYGVHLQRGIASTLLGRAAVASGSQITLPGLLAAADVPEPTAVELTARVEALELIPPGSGIEEVVAGEGIAVDNSNPLRPVVSATGEGAVGPQGPQGPAGPQGEVGPAGPTGPAGQDGADGAPGADGADGADGEDGAPGASAYQVAVANGFVGDAAAWLASLVGPQGPQGEQGETGATGATGATGPTGPTGPEGPAGEDGTDGADGTDAVWTQITQAAYDALDPPDPDTLYVVIG